MCGICGIVDYEGPGVDAALIGRMADAVRHRGPDDAGVHVAGPVGLGHRRLSIIDLTPTGHQPMTSADGRWTLVYNGELYNFPQLRRRLESQGVGFRGTSDSEVVLEAVARWGVDALAMFDGMFGLALWDGERRELHLARDRFGIKPLYYCPLPAGLLFGSEIKSILEAPGVLRRIDPQALHEYLYFGNALGGRTLFDGIARLPAGYRLVQSAGSRELHPFWRIEELAPVDAAEEEAVDEVRRRLEDAVRDHLISDVPVGVFLSGGIDSSAITALASRHYDGVLKTYSVGFDFEKGTNELPAARRVAERFGTDHQELHVQAGNVPDVIERLIRSHDEPFADAANIPLYLLCDQLAGSAKVILQGDGGDEIFAGYRRYNTLSFYRLWRPLSRIAVALDGLRPRGVTSDRAMRFLKLMAHSDPAVRAALFLTPETLDEPPTRVLADPWRRRVETSDPFARYREVQRGIAGLDEVQRMLFTDTRILLPDTYLEKVDKSTMAHSIEVRVPFLSTQLTSYVMGLPSSMKVRRGQKKFILRKALRGIVPDEILDGKKTGFSVPYGYWLREPLSGYVRQVLLDPTAGRVGLLDRDVVETLLREHVGGTRNHEFILYKLLNLMLWHQQYLG